MVPGPSIRPQPVKALPETPAWPGPPTHSGQFCFPHPPKQYAVPDTMLTGPFGPQYMSVKLAGQIHQPVALHFTTLGGCQSFFVQKGKASSRPVQTDWLYFGNGASLIVGNLWVS